MKNSIKYISESIRKKNLGISESPDYRNHSISVEILKTALYIWFSKASNDFQYKLKMQ
jgi:hypothetical protein